MAAATLVGPTDNSVHVSQMKDGDVAIIRSWYRDCTNVVGWIIQRVGKDQLVPIGLPSFKGWDTITILLDEEAYPEYRVEILKNVMIKIN